jgi:hypothetical protein
VGPQAGPAAVGPDAGVADQARALAGLDQQGVVGPFDAGVGDAGQIGDGA